ncbi:MAG: FG-GAP-like repeat-containing protein, partial [Verrucomicrobiota bacterium]
TTLGTALFLHDGTRLNHVPAWLRADGIVPSDMALGDVDGDGRPDLIISTTSSQSIRLYQNIGGAFSATHDWQSNENDDVREIKLTDFDLDGDLDLVALTWTGGIAVIRLYRNQGGSLNPASYIDYTVPQSGSGANAIWQAQVHDVRMSWADMDYDGKQECAVAYYYPSNEGNHVAVLEVSGNSLVQAVRFDKLEAPLGFADINVDGYPDLVANRTGGGPLLLANAGNFFNPFPVWEANYLGGAMADLAIADFDGDGDPDFALGARDLGTASLGHYIYRNDDGIYDNDPDWRSTIYVGTDGQTGETVEFVDFDGDGVKDVATERGVYLMGRILRDTTPPEPPRYVTACASPPGLSEVRIEWDAGLEADLAGYRIYRGFGSSGTDHYFMGEVPASQTHFIDPGVRRGYNEYYVRAIDEAGNIGAWA